ncbi:MAG TPA: hypothetical protein VLA24_12735 [Pseudomonadales bacterium]|nr:hypothetical protein [Pseudomonadales bacterium]
MSRFFQIYIVPAAVFISVVMGGGYGTGREVIEFFTQYGLLGGVFGIGVAACLFSLVLVCTYEFARVFNVYDYKSFFSQLIGPFWVVFELLYLLLFFLVLGVVGAAAGNILSEQFGLSSVVGMAAILLLVVGLVYFGRETVEKVLTFWSFGMYVIFVIYFVQVVLGSDIRLYESLTTGTLVPGWLTGGAMYAMYNLAIAPVLLFSTRAIVSRAQAIKAGCISGVLVMVPALLFHMSYAVGFPDVLNEPVPNYWMIAHFASPWLLAIFLVALLGTLIETGAGLVQGLIERVQSVVHKGGDEPLNHSMRVVISFVTLSIGGLLSTFGIIDLIAKGYAALSVGFALVYILPICTLGIFKIFRHKGAA